MKKSQIIFFVYFVIGLLTNVSLAQEEIKVDINWLEELTELTDISGVSYKIDGIPGAHITDSEFFYIKEFKRVNRNSEWNLTLLNYQTASVEQSTLEFFKAYPDIKITNELQFEYKNNAKKGRPITVISIVPFIKVNGVIRKITSVNFQNDIKNLVKNKSSNFAAASVLRPGSGEWYRIKVEADGVYKIDYAFLKSIGIDVDNIHPNDINIYGNGFGRLPEDNSKYRPDDLLKNDILVVGDADGSFDKNDYILFYAKGPHKWEQNGDGFHFVRNYYADHTAYFINVNSADSPARVQNAHLSNQPSTHTVTDFNSYAIHEKELRNVLKTGKTWYGEIFDANLTQSFSLNIPNLNTSNSASVRGYMAGTIGHTPSTGQAHQTYYTVKYKGTELGKININNAGSNSIRRNGFTSSQGVFNPTSNTFTLDVTFTRLYPHDVGYLDFLEVNARSYLKYFDGVEFRDLNSVGVGNVSEFTIDNFSSNGMVWETTETTKPKVVLGNLNNGTYTFKVDSDSLRSFVAFNNQFKTPKYVERVNHQNLHGLPQADYLIVTHPTFISQANRLADLHRGNGLTVHVVDVNHIYNEFSGGTQDPTAIRYFAKMFYDRAEGNYADQPKYLLLFGDGTYDPLDRVPNNNNMIVMYETDDSESYTYSIVTDDYFGLLDDTESMHHLDYLDIAIGRLIATTNADAVNLVNKIELYMKNGSNAYASANLACGEDGYVSTHGDWRLHHTMIGDDEENGWFLNLDLEPAYEYIETNHPELNTKKIYLDAFQQITTAGGERYPEVNTEIQKTIEKGTLITSFVGHGGPTGAAHERVITTGEIQALRNIDKLTLFVSATCEFARVDDNERVSIGEWMQLNKYGGAIALMTTTRAVQFAVNTFTTRYFYEEAFAREADGSPQTFGDIILNTKIKSVSNASSNNYRSFMLLGDPALRIALPYEKVVLDSINNVDINIEADTLRALSKVRMKGHIEDQYGNILTNYNGFIQPSIFDKPVMRKTLGQDVLSPVIDFEEQESVLYRGNVSVKDGYFEYEFMVPKDIDFSYGRGKASFYSWSNDNINSEGYSKEFYIGGIDTTGVDDSEGPELELYLNSDEFVNGGITSETPILIAKLYDESGINTVGNGIGHDITLVLDNETSKSIVLNEFYEADLDSYKSGSIRYQLDKLSPGAHTLTFKAWDINNNSSERTIEFVVQEKKEMALDHVLNYPNPFTTHTEFMFEHNQSCSILETQVEIYTVTGRLVKTINRAVETRGFRTEGIEWDGRDEFGDQLARGVYVYRITVKNPEGGEAQEMQKLYLLK